MAIAIDRPINQRPLTFDEFLAQYSGDKRYELIDGEVFDLEPTGAHEQVAGFITRKACVQIELTDRPWLVLQKYPYMQQKPVIDWLPCNRSGGI